MTPPGLVTDVELCVVQRQRLAGKCDLPAHEQHEAEAEEQQEKAGGNVLDADDLVIGGENVTAPEPELVMLVAVVMIVIMRVAM